MSVLYIVSIYRHLLYIVAIYRHVCIYVSVLYIISIYCHVCIYIVSIYPSCRYVLALYIVSIYRYVCMYKSVHYIVLFSRHVYVCVCVYVTYIHTYIHTYMFYFLLIMLCKFVNKKYIKSHDMRKHMVSERGGGADKRKTLSGWTNKSEDERLKPSYMRRNELSVQNGCLMWGICVIIPIKLRNKVLDELHVGHRHCENEKT